MIVDCAHYRDGVRQNEGPMPLEEAAARRAEGDFVWVGLYEPSEEEMATVREHFALHELAVEDAHHAHQRPKLEDYEDLFFAVLRTARYDDQRERVDFGEIHMFVGPDYLIVVRHGEASELQTARRRLEARPDLLRLGPAAAVWAVLDKVVDDYRPVVEGLENDIDEVEEAVFALEAEPPTERTYFLKREVIEFHHAVGPLLSPLEALERGAFPRMEPALKTYFRDVNDHVKRVNETIAAQRELLTGILEANLALVSVRQNEVVQKISAWAAIIAVPTFIASVYGMNFDYMPELDWRVGYPAAVATMALVAAALYRFFKRVRWL